MNEAADLPDDEARRPVLGRAVQQNSTPAFPGAGMRASRKPSTGEKWNVDFGTIFETRRGASVPFPRGSGGRARTRATAHASHQGCGITSEGDNHDLQALEMAEGRWRKLNGYELVPLVAHGVKYQDRIQLENKEERAAGSRPIHRICEYLCSVMLWFVSSSATTGWVERRPHAVPIFRPSFKI